MAHPSNLPEARAAAGVPALLSLDGRIGRLTYLVYGTAFNLLLFVVAVACMALAGGGAGILQYAAAAAALVLNLVLATRRLHDIGRPGWAAFGLLVPVVNLGVVLWLSCARGERGPNRFGPPPAPHGRRLVLLAWALPLAAALCIVLAVALAPHKSNAERARDEMEQAI